MTVFFFSHHRDMGGQQHCPINQLGQKIWKTNSMWVIFRPQQQSERHPRHQNLVFVCLQTDLPTRLKRYHIIKLFQPFGQIVRQHFLWHKYGPKRGEPKGFCFIEFSTKEVQDFFFFFFSFHKGAPFSLFPHDLLSRFTDLWTKFGTNVLRENI